MGKKCNSKIKYTTARVAGEMIGIVGRVLRSFLFNMLIFVLGFSAGYSYVATMDHYYAKRCTYAKYIQKIENKIDELASLNIEYSKKQDEVRELLRQFSEKLSHEEHCECDSNIGNFLIIR